jgi:integrase
MASTTGIRTRHSRTCKTRDSGSCNCDPSYEAFVYSKRDGKKIRRTFTGKGAYAAARSWRTDAAQQVKNRQLRAPASRTLRQEVDEWLAGARDGSILNKRKQPYKPAVIRNYELSLRLRVLPTLGDRRLTSVDLADLLDLQEALQGSGYSASVIRNSFVPLQAIFRRARRRGAVALNPALDLELPTSGSRERAATPAAAAELLETLAPLERALWATAFYAGLRRGELRALRVGDVDLAGRTIAVERGWDDKEGPIAPKSRAGRRRVFLLDALRPYLEPLVAGRPGDDLVFGIGAASPFDSRAVARKAVRAWKKIDDGRAQREEAALERYTLHEARHSFSTWMDHAGVSEERSDRYMGHARGSVSSRYRHLLPGQMTEDARRVDAYLAGAVDGKVVPIAAAQ